MYTWNISPFIYSLISFIRTFKYSLCKSWSFDLYPSIWIFGADVNGIVFLIPNSSIHCWCIRRWLLYINFLSFNLAIITYYFQQVVFCWFFGIFYIDNHIFCQQIQFYFLYFLITLPSASSMILNGRADTFALFLNREVSSFIIKYNVSCRFFDRYLIKLRKFLSTLNLLSVSWMGVGFCSFSAYIDVI